MAVNQTKEKPNMMLIGGIVGGILLLILMTWLYQKNFGEPQPLNNSTTQALDARWKHYIEETGGDFSKLPPADRAAIEKESDGYSQTAWNHYAKLYGH